MESIDFNMLIVLYKNKLVEQHHIRDLSLKISLYLKQSFTRIYCQYVEGQHCITSPLRCDVHNLSVPTQHYMPSTWMQHKIDQQTRQIEDGKNVKCYRKPVFQHAHTLCAN